MREFVFVLGISVVQGLSIATLCWLTHAPKLPLWHMLCFMIPSWFAGKCYQEFKGQF